MLLKIRKKRCELTEIKPAGNDFVWNLKNSPIEISVPGKQIPGWKPLKGCFQPVTSREGVYKGKVSDKVSQLTLVPIGCTKVRIVAFLSSIANQCLAQKKELIYIESAPFCFMLYVGRELLCNRNCINRQTSAHEPQSVQRSASIL